MQSCYSTLVSRVSAWPPSYLHALPFSEWVIRLGSLWDWADLDFCILPWFKTMVQKKCSSCINKTAQAFVKHNAFVPLALSISFGLSALVGQSHSRVYRAAVIDYFENDTGCKSRIEAFSLVQSVLLSIADAKYNTLLRKICRGYIHLKIIIIIELHFYRDVPFNSSKKLVLLCTVLPARIIWARPFIVWLNSWTLVPSS